MTDILYEHPLNERIRNYLKLEQLFAQASDCIYCEISVSHNVFFTALFAILDTLERNDIRGDLIKDLERLEQNLLIWSKSPEVDDSALEENLRETVKLVCQLKQSSPRWWQLKEDKFLSGLKQRFAIQGGSSSFDLPQLQFWLHRDKKQIQAEINQWMQLLDQIFDSLKLVLKFIRLRDGFEEIKTESGFYQDSGEGLLLLRIKVPDSAKYFPTVSGNRFRYSIRFMAPCPEKAYRYSSQATTFKLSRC